MLNEEHADIDGDYGDDHKENLYYLVSMMRHNVVVVFLPVKRIGKDPAAVIATQIRAMFTGIRFGLLVGIGGGVPSASLDVWLGDVVIKKPDKTLGSVIQYDSDETALIRFKRIGLLNAPP